MITGFLIYKMWILSNYIHLEELLITTSQTHLICIMQRERSQIEKAIHCMLYAFILDETKFLESENRSLVPRDHGWKESMMEKDIGPFGGRTVLYLDCR